MNRILVIDDEETISELLANVLTRLGYSVKTAGTGREGIRLFEKEIFDMVITDVVMPEMDGHAVVQHIRNSDRPHVPVMGISGTPWLLENSDFDSTLCKPFGIKQLADALEKMIANSCIVRAAS